MHVATGGYSGQVHIWQIPNDFSQVKSHNTLKNKKKKQETTLNNLPKLSSSEVHKENVQSIK